MLNTVITLQGVTVAHSIDPCVFLHSSAAADEVGEASQVPTGGHPC